MNFLDTISTLINNLFRLKNIVIIFAGLIGVIYLFIVRKNFTLFSSWEQNYEYYLGFFFAILFTMFVWLSCEKSILKRYQKHKENRNMDRKLKSLSSDEKLIVQNCYQTKSIIDSYQYPKVMNLVDKKILDRIPPIIFPGKHFISLTKLARKRWRELYDK